MDHEVVSRPCKICDWLLKLSQVHFDLHQGKYVKVIMEFEVPKRHSLRPSGRSLPLIFCIHVRSGPIYWGGYLPCRKDYKVMVFTCKKPGNIICDGILHVNMFHYFKIPYFTCKFFTQFIYNEYIDPIFYRTLFLKFSPVNPPSHGG
jgi:hypothetical protein